MVDINEAQENMAVESENQAVSTEEEVYEYEYVELEEGQELPEGYEYEYVEVDENGNLIESNDVSTIVDDDGQFMEAEQGEETLDALLGDEQIEVAENVPVALEDSVSVPELDNLQLEDITIPEFDEPDQKVEILNNVNDKSVYVEPEGVVFKNENTETLLPTEGEPVAEILPQEVVDDIKEQEVTVVEEVSLPEEIQPEEVVSVDDDVLLVSEEGEASLDQLLSGENEAFTEVDEILSPISDVEEDENFQKADDALIETLGDVVVPSVDEVAGGIPPIENMVMEEMIADGKMPAAMEVSDAEPMENSIVSEEKEQDIVAEKEEILAGVLEAVSDVVAEVKEEPLVTEEVIEVSDDVVVGEVVSQETEEVSAVEQADETIEDEIQPEILEPTEKAEEQEEISVVEDISLSEEEKIEETELSETGDGVDVLENVDEEQAADDETPLPVADLEEVEDIFIPETNVEDNLFIDEELELPPELTAVMNGANAGTEMLLIGNRDVEELKVNSDEICPQIVSVETGILENLAANAYSVSKNDGVRTLTLDEESNVICLDDLDFENNELRFWNMVLFNQQILPIRSPVSNVMLPLDHGVNRRISLIRNGVQKIKLFNEENIKIINATNACAKVEGRFICGDLGDNSGLIIDDCLTMPLADMYGKIISFEQPVSGFLSGPNGALVYFNELKQLVVPNNEKIKADADKMQYRISKWYSGTLNDKYFEFSENSESAEFEGNNEINAIHVNVNNSSYGWNVIFDNGLSMNLRDLREYQTKYGRMPSPNGIISYGKKTLKFSKVERIVVYESVQYFFYS